MKTKRAINQDRPQRRHELEVIYGHDLFEDGTVIRWYKCFGDPEDDPVFTYIAIKVGYDNWYSSGEYLSWASILFAIDDENTLQHEGLLEVAVEWREHDNNPPF